MRLSTAGLSVVPLEKERNAQFELAVWPAGGFPLKQIIAEANVHGSASLVDDRSFPEHQSERQGEGLSLSWCVPVVGNDIVVSKIPSLTQTVSQDRLDNGDAEIVLAPHMCNYATPGQISGLAKHHKSRTGTPARPLQ